MSPFSLLLPVAAALAAAPAPQEAATPSLFAIRVGRAETIAQGPIEHAVLLIENGKIVELGQDLPVERGIPVIDLGDLVAMPGLVNPYSRLGLEGRAGTQNEPQLSAAKEIYPRDPVYADVLELGVTTLGLYPPGTGLPGQAVAVRPSGERTDEMVIDPDAYLKVYFRSDSRSKKMVRDAFKKADEHLEKVKKEREKWEKEQEKAKKKEKEDKEDKEKKDDEKKDEDSGDKDDEKAAPKEFVPPEPDEKVVPFLKLRDKELRALVSISDAGDWLHWLDALGKEEFEWDLRVPMVRDLNLFEVKGPIGERKLRVVTEPQLSLHPDTLRQRNLPAELSRAGARLVLIPTRDSIAGHRDWLGDVGRMVGAGLEREVALRAVTLEPAEVLGLGARLGSLEPGKDANLVFFRGDPLEPSSRVKAVMLEGRIVHGEVQQ